MTQAADTSQTAVSTSTEFSPATDRIADPKPVYIFGRAGMAFTSGFYVGAYALFLWDFLSANYRSSQFAAVLPPFLVLLIIAAKHFVEFGLDAVSNLVSDLWVHSSRRQVFLAGMALHLASFALLVIVSWQVPSFAGQGSSAWAAVAGMVFAIELVRASGDALISNTYDSWAVSATKAHDRDYPIAKLFATGRVANRLFLFLGAGFAFVMFVTLHLGTVGRQVTTEADAQALQRFRSYFWVGLWGMAGVSQLVVFVLLWQLSRTVYDCTAREEKETRKPLDGPRLNAWVVFKAAADLRSLPAWLLFVCTYTMSMILGFAWPILVTGFVDKPAYYAVPLGLLLSGLAGALIGRRLASRRDDAQPPPVRLAALAVSAEAVMFVTLAALLAVRQSPGPWLMVAMIVIMFGTRVVDFIADPFVDSLLHEHTLDEQIRSAVVSARTAACNFIVGTCFAVTAVVTGTGNLPADLKHARFSLIVMLAIVALLGLAVGLSMLVRRGTHGRH